MLIRGSSRSTTFLGSQRGIAVNVLPNSQYSQVPSQMKRGGHRAVYSTTDDQRIERTLFEFLDVALAKLHAPLASEISCHAQRVPEIGPFPRRPRAQKRAKERRPGDDNQVASAVPGNIFRTVF